MYITIKRAGQGKLILEQNGKLPEVYENLTSLISDVFFVPINSNFPVNQESISIYIELNFNPPKPANQ